MIQGDLRWGTHSDTDAPPTPARATDAPNNI